MESSDWVGIGLIIIALIVAIIALVCHGEMREQKSFFKGDTYYILIEFKNGTRKWVDNASMASEIDYIIIKEIRVSDTL